MCYYDYWVCWVVVVTVVTWVVLVCYLLWLTAGCLVWIDSRGFRFVSRLCLLLGSLVYWFALVWFVPASYWFGC